MQVKGIIAVDLDGVLNLGADIKDEIADARNINHCNKLYDEGYTIVIYTARDVALRYNTIEWLKKYNVKYHDIVFNKIWYDYLIDDRAYHTFDDCLKALESQ